MLDCRGSLFTKFDREVDVFLFRSVRRQLLWLFGLVVASLLALAIAGIYGLVWHREAVAGLDFLLHRSPDQDKLSRSVSRIGEALYTRLDLRRSEAVQEIQQNYRAEVERARRELFEFRRRIEALSLTSEQDRHQRKMVLGRLDSIYGELRVLDQLSAEIRPVTDQSLTLQHYGLQQRAGRAIFQIQKTLDKLPAYQTRDWVARSLNLGQSRSLLLQLTIVGALVFAIIVFLTIAFCAQKWISGPMRDLARGCSRIANGDTSFRLPPLSRWKDEFADVVAGVNCMADRFQQSEEDLQEKVRERSEQLLRSQRLANVGFLAAGVAHEINNPLSAISMAAESLEMRLYDLPDTALPEATEVMDRVAMIRRESRRCGEITARLLDFSRADRGVRVMTDIAELVRDVLAMVRHLGRFSDRTIVFDCDRGITAEVSAAQIKQVILNLIANGLQATEPGGSVTIRLIEQVDSVIVSITDNGCGMDAETLQHIFDPFFSTRESGQGTGLGLSITHRIVEDHGGTVTPLSEGPGQGSTFQVRLPRRLRRASAA